jgi:hypothetical protein
MEEIPAHLRFPAPTGDRRVDVAAVVAWRRHVLEFFAGDAAAPWLTDRLRDEFARRELPDTTGDPAAAYDRIRRWREGIKNYCALIWDVIHTDPDAIAPPEVLHTLTRLLDPIDVGDRCEHCLERVTHPYGVCTFINPDWPPVPPEFAELMPGRRRWWQFWRR